MDIADLFRQGAGEWNKWAMARLREKEKLERTGEWNEGSDANSTVETWLLNSRADFRGKSLQNADFSGFIFPGEADFRKATFGGRTDFTKTRFAGPCQFGDAKFESRATFFDATFERSTDFRSATFKSEVIFGKSTFARTGKTSFDQAIFEASADFFETEFQGETSFRQTDFRGPTSFWQSHFHRDTSFNAIQAHSAFSLDGATFDEVPDFIQAHFPEAPRLDEISVPVIENVQASSSATNSSITARYRALKRLAIQGYDHDRELQFFADELRSQRSGWTLRALVITLYDAVSNFGRSIMRPIYWWAGATVVFGVAYYARHLLLGHPGCVDGPGSPFRSAIYVSLRKAFVFPGLGADHKINLSYACLYGTTELSDNARPLAQIPDSVAYLGIAQTVISAALIFLFLLAVRNQFRIK